MAQDFDEISAGDGPGAPPWARPQQAKSPSAEGGVTLRALDKVLSGARVSR